MADDTVELGIADLSDAVEVGAGGFGTVYRARQESLRRDVAVKVVTSTVKDNKVRIRFEREIQAMGMLSGHPNIVTVFDSGFTGSGQPYILMDYLEQGSLGDRLDRQGTLTYNEVLPIMVKVCGALETAHQAGILHRDIKPENVLVSAYGEPKLGDFGIARLKGGPETGTSSLTASIEHVAPELLDAKAPSIASDIYALGSTMYKLLTGQAAFIRPEDESIVPALTRIQGQPVPNLREVGVPDPVAALVERSMAKAPEARFATVAEMGQAIQAVEAAMGLGTTVMPVRAEEAAAAKEATRTIQSDDLARSIEDIRAFGQQPPHMSGPVSASSRLAGPGPAATGPGPAPVGTGAGGFPPGPQQGGGPAYAPPQYAAPPGPTGARKTPWALIAGVGVGLLVVAGVGVGLSMSGGSDTPTPTPPPPTTEVTVAPPTTEPTDGPYEYAVVRDDTGTLQIQAPATWTDVDGGPWVIGGQEVGQQVVVAPDLNGFRTTWNTPGLIFSLTDAIADRFTVTSILDALRTEYETQCDYQGRRPYADVAYTGERDEFEDCGETDTSYTIVAAEPEGGGALLVVQFQTVDDRDEDALDEALASFVRIPPEGDDAALPPDAAPPTEAVPSPGPS